MSGMENLSYEEKKLRLIEEITAAFDGVQREEGLTLHETAAMDDYIYDPDDRVRVKARAQDCETRWQDVPPEHIARLGWFDPLLYLDPKGFRYYIPAFLIWYLTSHTDSNIYDSVLSFLDLDFLGSDGQRYLPLVSFLTPEQSRAIAHFLVFEAEQAEYWRVQDEQRMAEELEEELKTRLASGDYSEEQCEADRKELQQRLMRYAPRNEAQSALDRYWGQFLRST